MKKLLVFLLPLVMLAACQPKGEKVPAIDLTDMDLTVSPGDDRTPSSPSTRASAPSTCSARTT